MKRQPEGLPAAGGELRGRALVAASPGGAAISYVTRTREPPECELVIPSPQHFAGPSLVVVAPHFIPQADPPA
jgi:hypothetical protein